MIKFFRKIRQQLLTENKFSKYLIYAIGEVLLVIVGVMIALYANYKIDETRRTNIAYNSLINLRLDIENDIKAIERTFVPRFQKQDEAKERLTKFLEDETAIIEDSLQFVIDIQYIAWYITIDPNKSAIEDLINSGGFKLIENKDLLNALLDYKRRMENIIEFDVIQRAFFLDIYKEYSTEIVKGLALQENLTFHNLLDTVKLKKLPFNALDAHEIRDSDYLRKLLISASLPRMNKKVNYLRARDEGNKILVIIDDVLKNYK